MWETARPYFYLRTTADRRIVFGGLDDPFATPSRRDKKLPAKARALARLFARLFPSLAFEADYAWTGTFADTSDGLHRPDETEFARPVRARVRRQWNHL